MHEASRKELRSLFASLNEQTGGGASFLVVASCSYGGRGGFAFHGWSDRAPQHSRTVKVGDCLHGRR